MVDDEKFFKENIDGANRNIEESEELELAVNFFETFAFDELDKTKNDEEGDREEKCVAGVFGDGIPKIVNARAAVGKKVTDSFVEAGEANGSFGESSGADVNELDGQSEGDSQQSKDSADDKKFFRRRFVHVIYYIMI